MKHNFFKILFIFLCIITSISAAQLLPQLSQKDVRKKIDEILSAHAQYKKLEPLLVQRALKEFINEIDPTKTYLILPQIEKWIHPSDQLLEGVLADYNRSNYEVFYEIFQEMLAAIHRRALIEEEIKLTELPKDVSISEFKDLDWAATEEDLKLRLLKVKSLQLDAAALLNKESLEITLQRIAKRRMKREEEFLVSDKKDKERFIYSLVLKATASTLDSHTSYFTPAEAEQFLMLVQQRFFGLGIQIRDDLNGFSVVKIIEGGPAAKGKLIRVNDKIIAVDNEPVIGLDVVEVSERMRGENGTSVVLTVLREKDDGGVKKDEKLDLTLKRGEVVLKDARIESSFEPFGDGIIAYIRLYSFYQDPHNSSVADVGRIINEYKAEHNLKGVILDVRNNLGGLLTQAVAVSGLFINKGVVVSVKHSDGKVQHLRDLEGKVVWDGPLIVLSNKLSASAAEIVVQALQDYGRAVIVGDEHTFGKGTFQVFTLDSIGRAKVNSEGEYKVTRGKYYTVSGKSPQLVGAKVDVVVPGAFAHEEVGEKYTKYPIENDSIPAQFNDDFSDISGLVHEQLAWLYGMKMQQKLTVYEPIIPVLVSNSKIRIEKNKAYANFMEKMQSKNRKDTLSLLDEDEEEIPDFQYDEALNIMKDLIVLEPKT